MPIIMALMFVFSSSICIHLIREWRREQRGEMNETADHDSGGEH